MLFTPKPIFRDPIFHAYDRARMCSETCCAIWFRISLRKRREKSADAGYEPKTGELRTQSYTLGPENTLGAQLDLHFLVASNQGMSPIKSRLSQAWSRFAAAFIDRENQVRQDSVKAFLLSKEFDLPTIARVELNFSSVDALDAYTKWFAARPALDQRPRARKQIIMIGKTIVALSTKKLRFF